MLMLLKILNDSMVKSFVIQTRIYTFEHFEKLFHVAGPVAAQILFHQEIGAVKTNYQVKLFAKMQFLRLKF